MIRSFIVNLNLAVFKIIFGTVFYSQALFADGIHSLSDLLTDILVIFGFKISTKPADDDHPIGHGNVEYIISLILSIVIISVAIMLGYNMVKDWDSAVVLPSLIVIIFTLGTVISKYCLSSYLIRKGSKLNSHSIIASGKESRVDAVSSIFVFLGVSLTYLAVKYNIDYLLYSEKIATVFVILFIFRVGFDVFFTSSSSLIGQECDSITKNRYNDVITNVEGVVEIANLNIVVHGMYYQVLVNIVVDGNITVKEGHDIAKKVRATLLDFQEICYVIVHIDPSKE